MQECARPALLAAARCPLTPIPGKVEKCVAKASVSPSASVSVGLSAARARPFGPAEPEIRPTHVVDGARSTFISRARISSKVLFACTSASVRPSFSPPPPPPLPHLYLFSSLRRRLRFSTLLLPSLALCMFSNCKPFSEEVEEDFVPSPSPSFPSRDERRVR